MQPTPDPETGAHDAATGLDVPLEAPPDDAAEQSVIADPADDDGALDAAAVTHRGLEVGEWDAAEQVRTAGREDDYR